MELLRPFGPTIGKFKLPENILTSLIKSTDQVLKDKKESWGKKLMGKLENEWRVLPEYLELQAIDYFHESIKSYGEANGLKSNYPSLKVMWLNEMNQNEYNPIHIHNNGLLSSVVYLKVPDLSQSDIGNKKSLNRVASQYKETDGRLEFVFSTTYECNNGNLTITPEVGDFYLFPSSLLHVVYPYQGKQTRRSISFNANIN